MSSKSSTSSDVMIEARGLSKFYGEFAATRDVTFSVPRGQVCAFLGPNGAGKSTTMKMLTGFLSPSRGEAFLAGYNVAENRIAASEHLGVSARERSALRGDDSGVAPAVHG
jgi:ABC-2 type transport system ATP-binding protein